MTALAAANEEAGVVTGRSKDELVGLSPAERAGFPMKVLLDRSEPVQLFFHDPPPCFAML